MANLHKNIKEMHINPVIGFTVAVNSRTLLLETRPVWSARASQTNHFSSPLYGLTWSRVDFSFYESQTNVVFRRPTTKEDLPSSWNEQNSAWISNDRSIRRLERKQKFNLNQIIYMHHTQNIHSYIGLKSRMPSFSHHFFSLLFVS